MYNDNILTYKQEVVPPINNYIILVNFFQKRNMELSLLLMTWYQNLNHFQITT